METTEYLERIQRGHLVLLRACDDPQVSDSQYDELREATAARFNTPDAQQPDPAEDRDATIAAIRTAIRQSMERQRWPRYVVGLDRD